uniref:Uncharacterized protein n=1 Tax=Anguilla anguilla TaxID=7936 RepID=A0A0E9SCF3_ANGAN
MLQIGECVFVFLVYCMLDTICYKVTMTRILLLL